MRAIDEIYGNLGITPAHAPYIDEQTAELSRRLIKKDSEIESLGKELERLKKENKTLSSSVKPASKSDNTAHKESEGKGEFSATFYTAYCPTGCTGVTASGYDVSNTIYSPEGYRIIAADTGVLPMDSIVDITLENGDSFRAKVMDRGGDIKGNRLDILVASRDEAYALGRQNAKVSVVK